MLQELVLADGKNQGLTTTIYVNGSNIVFKFMFMWNKTAGYWVMTVTNLSEDTVLLDSIPLVTGKIYCESLNILRAFGYLQIGKGFLIPRATKSITDYPVFNTLNSEFALVWDDND